MLNNARLTLNNANAEYRDVYNVLFGDAYHGTVTENWSISEQLAMNCSREINYSGVTNCSGFGFSSKNYQDLKKFFALRAFLMVYEVFISI